MCYTLQSLHVCIRQDERCNAVIEYLNPIGFTNATNLKTVMRWNSQFCDTIKNVYPNIANGKAMELLLFGLYSEVKTDIMEYCSTKVADLTADIVHSQLVDEILPNVDVDFAINEQ